MTHFHIPLYFESIIQSKEFSNKIETIKIFENGNKKAIHFLEMLSYHMKICSRSIRIIHLILIVSNKRAKVE